MKIRYKLDNDLYVDFSDLIKVLDEVFTEYEKEHTKKNDKPNFEDVYAQIKVGDGIKFKNKHYVVVGIDEERITLSDLKDIFYLSKKTFVSDKIRLFKVVQLGLGKEVNTIKEVLNYADKSGR